MAELYLGKPVPGSHIVHAGTLEYLLELKPAGTSLPERELLNQFTQLALKSSRNEAMLTHRWLASAFPTLRDIINTDTAMQTRRFGQISDYVPRIRVRVILLHTLQVGPFRARITPSDVHTALYGRRPALYPPLLHAGKRDPFL